MLISNRISDLVADIVEVGGDYRNLAAIMNPRTKAELLRECQGTCAKYEGRAPDEPYPTPPPEGGQVLTTLWTDFGPIEIIAREFMAVGDITIMDIKRLNGDMPRSEPSE